jgi:hypothetical protein
MDRFIIRLWFFHPGRQSFGTQIRCSEATWRDRKCTTQNDYDRCLLSGDGLLDMTAHLLLIKDLLTVNPAIASVCRMAKLFRLG